MPEVDVDQCDVGSSFLYASDGELAVEATPTTAIPHP
jgi:hypothetical protein